MVWCALALAAVVPPTAAAAPDPLVPPAELAATLDRFNAHAVYPLPRLSPSQLEALADGEVVRFIERRDGEHRRVVGLLVARAPQRDLWVASQDLHFVATDGLTERRLWRDEATGRASWYGHIDVPAPFKDRHWLVEVWNNHALAAASDDALWEHPWRLVPGGVAGVADRVAAGQVGAVTPDIYDGSIETPVNEGAWIAMDLPGDHAIVAYNAAFVVGGNIPDGLFTRFALVGMERMLRDIEARAQRVIPSHYVRGHEPLSAGGPGLVPPYE